VEELTESLTAAECKRRLWRWLVLTIQKVGRHKVARLQGSNGKGQSNGGKESCQDGVDTMWKGAEMRRKKEGTAHSTAK